MPNQRFVLKPPDKGCGADVFTLSPGDVNANALIESSLGNPAQLMEMFGLPVVGQTENYVVLQEFVPHLRENENRGSSGWRQDFLAVIVKFRRTMTSEAIILSARALPPLQISDSAETISKNVAEELLTYGIHFVGIDVSGENLIELNLVNPGGISGHLEATGVDIGQDVCQAVLSSCLDANH